MYTALRVRPHQRARRTVNGKWIFDFRFLNGQWSVVSGSVFLTPCRITNKVANYLRRTIDTDD